MAFLIKRCKMLLIRSVWYSMATSAIIAIFVVVSFPLIKASMLNYPENNVSCETCHSTSECIINGTVLGDEFDEVPEFYTLPISMLAFIVNFLLAMRIFGSRLINVYCPSFVFFGLFVFPARLIFLAMQTLEFTRIGGDSYTLMLFGRAEFNCNLLSGNIDAVFLMHIRFFLLIADFVTFHVFIVAVPFYFGNDQIDEKDEDDCSIENSTGQKPVETIKA